MGGVGYIFFFGLVLLLMPVCYLSGLGSESIRRRKYRNFFCIGCFAIQCLAPVTKLGSMLCLPGWVAASNLWPSGSGHNPAGFGFPEIFSVLGPLLLFISFDLSDLILHRRRGWRLNKSLLALLLFQTLVFFLCIAGKFS